MAQELHFALEKEAFLGMQPEVQQAEPRRPCHLIKSVVDARPLVCSGWGSFRERGYTLPFRLCLFGLGRPLVPGLYAGSHRYMPQRRSLGAGAACPPG
ncbi:hypothetical protein SRHO_G00270670 [Serrasalmus rhombeus]